jgi:Short C-terminal domain
MGLLKTAARAAVASSVHGRVQRRQQARWAAADQGATQSQPTQAAAAPGSVNPTHPTVAPPTSAASTDELLVQLERLGKLRDSGVLTEAEFQTQKARILG